MKFLKDKNVGIGVLPPFLLSLYPTMKIAVVGLSSIYLGEFIIIIFSLFIIVSFLYLFLGFLFKDWNKTSLILFIAIFYFYFFRFFSDFFLIPIVKFTELYLFKFRVRYFFILIAAFLIYLFIKLFKVKKISDFLIRFLIFPFIGLYALFLIQGVRDSLFLKFEIERIKKSSDLFRKTNFIVNNDKNKKFPDVYYIILDTYMDVNVLNEAYDCDLSWFTASLKEKGFLLPQKSFSNYGETQTSLSSSLNLFLHDLMPQNIKSGKTEFLIRNNNLKKFFYDLDYKIIEVGYDYPFKITFADNSFNNTLFSYVKNYFLASWYDLVKPIGLLSNILGYWSILNYYWLDIQYYRYSKLISDSINYLRDAIEINGPKFVFAHIMCPHGPYVYDKDGNFCGVGESIDGYVGQAEFISRRICSILDEILIKDNNAIIILQGDHGACPTDRFFVNKFFNIIDLPGDVKNRFSILNAYYFPDKNKDDLDCLNNDKFTVYKDKEIFNKLYRGITPVNSFRIVLNRFFGKNLKLLEDNSFMGPNTTGIFVNVNGFRE